MCDKKPGLDHRLAPMATEWLLTPHLFLIWQRLYLFFSKNLPAGKRYYLAFLKTRFKEPWLWALSLTWIDFKESHLSNTRP